MVTSVLAALEMMGLLSQLETDGLNLDTISIQGEDARALIAAAFDYLLQRGLLIRGANGFELTPHGREICEDKGYLVWLSGGYGEPLRHLDSLLLGEARYGDTYVRDGRWIADGSALLGRRDVVPEAMELLSGVPFERVLDFGCGNARFLVSLCERFGCDGVGVDLSPAACKEAERTVAAASLESRIQIQLGDAADLESIQLEQTQLVVALFLLHEISSISRADLVKFLREIAARLPVDAHLLAAEVEPPSRRDSANVSFTPEFSFVHAIMRQTLLPEAAWREMLAEGGFSLERVVHPRQPGGLLMLARSTREL